MAHTSQPSRGVSKPKGARARGVVQPPVSAAAARRAVAPAAEAAEEVDTEYPRVKYRKAPVTSRTPNGWECKKVYDEAEEARLGKDWVDSPDDV